MRFIAIFLLISGGGLGARAALPAQEPPAVQEPAKPSPPPAPETEQVQEPQPPAPQPVTQLSVAGSMEPAQVKELLHRVWLAEYRVNDLLTDLHPERWKLSPEAGEDFNKLLEKLRNEVATLEQWRSQFENRAESSYLGFETYAGVGAVLPELDSMARRISKYENSSLAAQYTQAESQLFELQQALHPYLSILLRAPDETLVATQNNLAKCQTELGFAMRPSVEPATPMKNVLPRFKGRPRGLRAHPNVPKAGIEGAAVDKPKP